MCLRDFLGRDGKENLHEIAGTRQQVAKASNSWVMRIVEP